MSSAESLDVCIPETVVQVRVAYQWEVDSARASV